MPPRRFQLGNTRDPRVDKFAFPHCATWANLRYCVTRTLKFARAMPTSFSCQRSFVSLNNYRVERLRSRRSASSVWSRCCEQ